MKVIVVPEPVVGARMVADRIESLLRYKLQVVLGLATGSSPELVYCELVARGNRINWLWATTINLDNYCLPHNHPRSYRAEMNANLFDHIEINKDTQTFVPNGQLQDEEAAECECFNYEKRIIERGGIDLQILGIGENGHIAFDEPGSSFDSRTRRVKLSESTREVNKRFFGGDITKVPTHAVTMGIGTIMEAREIWLLAWGLKKAEAIVGAIEGPVTTQLPASVLQLHSNTTFLVDKEAGSLLKRSYISVSNY